MAPLWRLGSDVLWAADPAAAANGFVRGLESDRVAASVLAPELSSSVLTISFSSSVLEAIRRASVEEVMCMRSDPGGEGVRMAEALIRVRTRVIDDQEALETVPAQAVVVGADAVTPTTLINKVKTRALAEACREKGVPCYAVAGETKFVASELPAEAPFERVPLELFTAIATRAGLLSPAEASRLASRAVLHPDLIRLLSDLRQL